MAHSGFRRDPAAVNTEAIEDYAKAIYALERQGEGPVGNSALAARLGVSPGTATAMAKRLAELGFAEYTPYHGVSLTEAGERIALETIRHHRLIESFLADTLGMPWDKVHDEAEVLEHYISEDLEERIASTLGDPSHDPHGDPIPDRSLTLAEEPAVALAAVEVGQSATFTRVSDSDPEMLRYLDQRGIRPGVEVTVSDRDPFGGAIMLVVEGSAHAIGTKLADRMLVAT
jgi:DtxR family Mn-dependent transcriptional regulator